MAFFKGFSTIGLQNRWKLEDTALIKRDILNHFQTRRGERLNNPGFGSIIWEMIFEGMSDESRVSLKDITITRFQYGFQIEMDLYFVNSNVAEPMYIQFNQEAQIMTSI